MFDYTIIRSKRITIAIHIKPTGDIEVRAPKKVPKERIENFLKLKEKWIEEKVRIAKVKLKKREDFAVAPKDTLTFLGEDYPIYYAENCSFDNEKFTIPKGEFSEVKPLIIKLYKKLAREVIVERVQLFSEKTGLIPTAIRINSATTRWGSCSGKNSLNFSWRLIFAPLDVLDYVVVHELSHIAQLNHSAKFWLVVQNILPDYKDREKQLKRLQDKISREDWT